jgi:competence protein ComEC
MKQKITTAVILSLFVSVFAVQAQMRVHLINVGQGCATLVEFPCAAILIDVGGESNQFCRSSDSLKAYLDGFFDRRTDLNHTLQCVYLTHPHIDHTRSVNLLLDPPYRIMNAVTDGLPASPTSGQTKLHEAAQNAEENGNPNDDIGLQPVNITLLGASGLTNEIIDPVTCPGGTDPIITALWGMTLANPGWTAEEFNTPNNHSLVIRIQYGTSSLLITGDLEEPAQRNLMAKYNGTSLLDADVYVVGHHGSKNGTLPEFLRKISPKMALIGVGDPNHESSLCAFNYGHPNKRLLDSLQKRITMPRPPIHVKVGTSAKHYTSNYLVSKAIYATAWDSNIILEADDAGNWHKVEPGSDSITVPNKININTATLSDLLTLPGIGETKAKAILKFRNDHGNFSSIEQLDAVDGIGPATIKLIKPFIRF